MPIHDKRTPATAPAPTTASSPDQAVDDDLLRLQSMGGAGNACALERTKLDAAIDEWEGAGMRLIAEQERWLEHNWTLYLAYTSSNPHISWGEQATRAALGNAVTGLLTDAVLGEAIGKGSAGLAGAAFGGAAAGPLGSAIGFALAVGLETAAELIFDALAGTPNEDERAADLTDRLGEVIDARVAEIGSSSEAARTQLREQVDRKRVELGECGPEALHAALLEVAEAMEALEGETIDPTDQSLLRNMLDTWVLEHAATPARAGRDVSATEWHRNVDRAGTELEGRPTLFAYQTRGELSRAGLDVAAAEDMIDRATSLDKAADYGGAELDFTHPADGTRFLRWVRSHVTAHSLQPIDDLALARGPFDLTVTLYLSMARGSYYVTHWKWDLAVSEYAWHGQRGATFTTSPRA